MDRNGATGESEAAATGSVTDSVEENDGAAAESSDSDEDATDGQENTAAGISVEDEKPIFYAQVEQQAVPPAV